MKGRRENEGGREGDRTREERGGEGGREGEGRGGMGGHTHDSLIIKYNRGEMRQN